MLLSGIAAILMLLGNTILVQYKTWVAFVIMAIANGMYIYYWIIREEWATCVLVSVFFVQNIWGIIKWRKSLQLDKAIDLVRKEN